ncbi:MULTISPECIES: ABC transporter substrate-binding protein [unclassified Sinorhizobium]|uniref:ABC transporter substrate-binding protein n=1 Tax=unclassified Sinorhizobium TaxID=2613772 RepID=UPI003524BD18
MKAATKVLTISAVLALGLMSTSLSAAELRVTVWTGNKAQLEMLNGFGAGFAKTHPGVTVKFETIPAADYTQKLTFQLAGGNPPDLAWMMEDAAPAFENAGIVADVGPALKAAQGYELADFSPAAMGLWASGDKVFGIPFSTSPFMILYNKTLFDKAGLEDPGKLADKGEWTMEKFREVAKALKDKTGKWGFEFKDGQGYESRMMHAVMPPIRVYGGFAWQDGQCGFNKPEAVAAMTLLHDMVFKDKSIVPPGEQGDFFSGNSAMTINQISRAPNLASAKFEWGIAPLPTGPAGASPVIGQAGLVIFNQGKQKELATEFLAYMTDKANVATMAQFFPPARQSVLQDKAFTQSNAIIKPQQMAYVADAIASGQVLPSHEHSPQILAALAPRMDAFWKADANPQKSMDAVCAAIQPLL